MEEKTIKDELRELKEIVSDTKKEKERVSKPFRMPWKARLSPRKLRKGYITIAQINENMAVDFIREPIIDGTVKLDDTYHAIEDFDIFNYKNRPFIFIAKNKLNPYNPLEGQHETYGQKYVMARMEGERITAKKALGWGVSIGILIIVGVIVYALFTGGGA
jgi:hypothetical protein